MKSRLSALAAAYDRLSSREQLMLLFVGLGGLFTVLFVGGFLVSKDLDARAGRISAKEKKLTELVGLRADYQRRLAEQNRLAEQLRGNGAMRILSFIEDVSKEANIDIGNAAERQGGGDSILREEAAEVVIRNVSLDRLYDFLRRVEEKGPLVMVRRLAIKSRHDNPQRLDATVTVGTFKIREGG